MSMSGTILGGLSNLSTRKIFGPSVSNRQAFDRGVSLRAKKSEESAVTFTSPQLVDNLPVTTPEDSKLPSPAINIISPISRCVSLGFFCFRCKCAIRLLKGSHSINNLSTNMIIGKKNTFFSYRWSDGVPPAMGGHYMPAGTLAPLSKSKGPGVDIDPLYFSYPSEKAETQVAIYENDFAAATGLADMIAEASAAAIAEKGSFVIALSGGSLIRSLEAVVGREDIDFTRWWVVFVDERVVPHSSPESTFGSAQESLLRKVAIPFSHIIAIKEGLSASQAAEHYTGRLLDMVSEVMPLNSEGFPVMDLVLLGVGPDGHVASLFPNRIETAASSGWVLPVLNSPKPPAERITLTMPVLNAAKKIAVVALGSGKAEIVHRALEVQSLPGALPVQLVQPNTGSLSWILDKSAADQLNLEFWVDKQKFPRNV